MDLVRERYGNSGFHRATVTPARLFSDDRTRVAIVFRVNEGPRTSVQHVVIVGNQRTRNATIARELTLAPGDAIARQASFVVTNGGASTSYQALAEGKPVLGVPSNLDQYLSMTAIERARAGRLVRSGEATPRAMREALASLLDSEALREGARAVAAAFARANCHERFGAWLGEVLQTNERTVRHEIYSAQ